MSKHDANWLYNIRHTAAHLMAHAVLNLFGPKTKFGIGPVIEQGFYYDFNLPQPISDTDLPKIEQEMRRLIKQGLAMKQEIYPLAEAKKLMKNQPYKLELLKDIAGGKQEKTKGIKKGQISFYRIGKFLDLCKGGHVKNSKDIPAQAFKLTNTAGAYWKGSEKNPMLTRIYAAAFATEKELNNYLRILEEAKKRDHRKRGVDLGLFMFHETSPGIPYWLPKGLVILNELIDFWRKEHAKRGYQEISTPLVNKKSLWETSGHWEHYRENMFIADMGNEEIYGVKAMNCPNAMVVFGSTTRSYKDLPLRFSDTDVLHRFEPSGTLNGLFRVRAFRQDDSHNFITEEQIADEYGEIFEITKLFYGIFKLPYRFRLGTRPEKFLGEIRTWNRAEEALKKILTKAVGKKGLEILEGDGAFYGPKVDILMKDSLGRDWQMGTIQLDFQQPRRFKLEYTDQNGKKKNPVVIHRVIYGSLERFVGILIEHFAGAFPLWLAPVQVTILPINDRLISYARSVEKELRIQNQEIRIYVDERSESVSKKIREAEQQKIPYMLIVGKKEKAARTVSVRQRGENDLGCMNLEKFAEKIRREIDTKAL